MNLTRADNFMSRILFVNTHTTAPATESYEEQSRTAENALGFSLVFSGVRCVLQYAVLPFLLPIIGVATDAAIPMLMVINVFAMISIFFSLRRFWKIGYKYRWQYLGVAIGALVLLCAFMVYDVITLQAV